MTGRTERSLVVFTSLPKVGGHTTITVGLIRLLKAHFTKITVIAKELPGHGVSKDAVDVLTAAGAETKCVRPGLLGILQMIPAVLQASLGSGLACDLLTIDMGRLSPRLARLFRRNRTVYYHIKHELTPSTLGLLNKIDSTFDTICFISAATAHEFGHTKSGKQFPVLIQPSEIENAQPAFKHPRGPVRLGFLGRLSADKGSKALLEFMQSVKEPCQLVVAGDGEFANDFKAASKANDKVQYLGAFDVKGRKAFLTNFFASVDYLLVPTQNEWEGTPTVILEALQFGVPTLATACGGTVGFSLIPFNDGRNDSVRLINREEFFGEVERIVAAGRPTRRISEQAKDYFEKHFSNRVIESQWLRLLGDNHNG